MTCTPLITPADCAPYAPTPVLSAQPQPTGSPEIHVDPTMPPIGLDNDPIGWIPNLSEISLDGVADGALLLAAVVVAILIMTIMILVPATALGWKPTRLRNWLIGSLLAMPGATALWAWDVLAPGTMATEASRKFMDGQYTAGMLGMAVVLVPAAWFVATAAHANRRVQLATVGLQSPARTERALWAQAQREQRAAARLSRRRLPFMSGYWSPQLVIGRLASEQTQAPTKSMFRMLLGRAETRLILPWIALAEHVTTVASSGSGKTTLLKRTAVSWFATGWTRHRQWWRADRPGRPQVIIVDCNGGPESRKLAESLGRWFLALGVPAERIGRFPEIKLNLWGTKNIDDLRSILSSMVSGGSTPTTDTEKYFHEIRETLIHLIVDAPAKVELVDGVPTAIGSNPPRDWVEFLRRFDERVLAQLWGGIYDPNVLWAGVSGVDREIASTIEGKQPVMSSARGEFGNLYRSLGDAFDGDKELTDYDLLYITLEGVKTPDRARAQFGAIGSMLEQLADKKHGRSILMVVDEFSAVSDGKTRAVKWVERLRKAGIGSWWIAQSWQGLGHDEDSRMGLVSAASGGSLLGRTTNPEQISNIYGSRKKFDLSRKLIGGSSLGDEGNVQAADEHLAPPNKLRSMEKGDVVHVANGRAAWGRVSVLNDADLPRVRPLPGMAASLAPAPTEEPDAALAPVIDMTKRRPA
ncbi:hypothetical protein [Nocardia salmonicida]|uniref:hypothetical protein n=1 Tax=Nocardia salmonicida TaxID=53431 RepID=UPI0033EC9B7A